MNAVPTSENRRSAMANAVRLLVLLDRASVGLGGAARLGDVLGIGRRAVNHKLAGDRATSPSELRLAAAAIDKRASELAQLAADLREMAP